jgi:hypothetical protein
MYRLPGRNCDDAGINGCPTVFRLARSPRGKMADRGRNENTWFGLRVLAMKTSLRDRSTAIPEGWGNGM